MQPAQPALPLQPAQESTGVDVSPPGLVHPEAKDRWEFDTSLFVSDPPGSGDRVTAIVYADRGPLHLEGRYGYEDAETGSVFVGWTFAGGTEVAATVRPMIGAVFGRTDGIAPALEMELGWRRFSWYVEGEYLLDAHDSSDDFFYSWSTLMFALDDWVGVGLVTERSKLVETDFEVQHGLALQIARQRFSLGVYAYNLGTSDSYAVVSFGMGL